MPYEHGWPYVPRSLQTIAGVLITALLLVTQGNYETAHAATFIINNLDGPGEGFNDNGGRDFASWQGGNTGNTLGEQRLQALQEAADVWGATLQSTVPIMVDATMDALDCAPQTGALGGASPIAGLFHTPSQTWQVIAKANADLGNDFLPDTSDIRVRFNSEVGTFTCLSTRQWYYGLDRQPPAGTIDFYATVVHEIVHGLGFADSIRDTTGAFSTVNSLPFRFDTFLADRGLINKKVTDMTDGERLSAIASQDNLVWTGANVTALAATVLSAGRHASTGEVLMYAPFPVESGSSVAHFDTSLTPDEMMEPSGTPTVDDRLTKALLQDLGWMLTTTTHPTVPVGNLENPGADSYKSGIGIISGWVCSASSVLVTVDGTAIQAAYGTERTDTASVCGDSNNGFGALYNWNRFGDGTHTAVAYADGVEFGRANFTVTTFGTEFMTGIAETHISAGRYDVPDFPVDQEMPILRWDQSVQNFVIESQEWFYPDPEAQGASSSLGNLENPGAAAYKSGIGIISGWVCSANEVVVTIDGVAIETAYGTERTDTVGVCGDSNNGFAALYNWNRLGDGPHQAIASADGVQFAWANFIVTTFGVEFLSGIEETHKFQGRYLLSGFPLTGVDARVRWDQSVQNFVIWGRLP